MSKPTAPNITSDPTIGDTTLTFYWTEPTDIGGSNIISYTLSDISNISNVTLQLNQSPYTVSGLTNGTGYVFNILATNDAGDGPVATYNEGIPGNVAPVTAPGAPGITADPIPGNGSLTFGWTAPTDTGGSSIINYTLSYPGNSYVLTLDQSPFKVTYLENGNTYVFTILATNSAGDGAVATYNSAQPTEVVPSAPNIEADPIPGDGFLTFAWTAPTDDGGNSIVKYVLSDSNDPANSIPLQLNESPYTITGLTNGTEYTYNILAVNGIGEGASVAYNAATPFTTPGAPGITADPIPGNGTLTFAWTEPTDTGGDAIIEYILSDADDTIIASKLQLDQSPYTVSGLVNGNVYIFGIAAINSAGIGIVANYNSATPMIVPPSEPIITPDPTVGDMTLTFSWTEPNDDGGSEVINYVLSDVNNPGTSANVGINESPYTVSGLINDTQYTFQILATNSAGYGNISTYNAATPSSIVITVPGKPVIVADPTIGDGSLTFTWSEPGNTGGSEILSYTLSDVNNSATTFNLQLDDSPYTVNGFTNGTPYTFQILATNIAGDGDNAIYTEATPAVGSVPLAPQLIGASIRPIILSESAIQIYWEPPLDDGGFNISSYTYYINMDYNTPFEILLPASNFIITSLTIGTEYTIEIGAVNSAGIGALAKYRTVQPGNKPTIPSSITVTNPTPTSALVTWSAPADDGGATIKWYVITPYSSDPADPFTAYDSSASAVDASYGHYGKRSANGTDTSIIFSGLTEGNTYTFGVNAVNDPGYSPVLVSDSGVYLEAS